MRNCDLQKFQRLLPAQLDVRFGFIEFVGCDDGRFACFHVNDFRLRSWRCDNLAARFDRIRPAGFREVPGSLLCGERAGKRIDGFDLGNSPREFTAEAVANKVIVHCTTNGTVALESCRGAEGVLIGAFVNLDAIIEELGKSESSAVLCAGTDGEITAEDVLFAGAVGFGLRSRSSGIQLNDQAPNRDWFMGCSSDSHRQW